MVLGGDHSVAMGTIAGLARHFNRRREKLGLIWFDAHADANTPETSPSGNIHGMPLAAVLGHGAESLVNLAGFLPMVEASRAALVGIRDVDPAERATVKSSGIGAFTMRDVDERGMRSVMEEAIKRATTGTAGVHVSFDLDGIDPDFAPGVGTPSPGGLSYREAHLAMEMLADTGKVVSRRARRGEPDPRPEERHRGARGGAALLAAREEDPVALPGRVLVGPSGLVPGDLTVSLRAARHSGVCCHSSAGIPACADMGLLSCSWGALRTPQTPRPGRGAGLLARLSSSFLDRPALRTSRFRFVDTPRIPLVALRVPVEGAWLSGRALP